MKATPFGSAVYSVLNNKCPGCHAGDVFEVSNPYTPKKGLRMNPSCQACGQRFEPETGFYYGAMYVSYALSVGIGFAVFLALDFPGIRTLYSVIVSSAVLLGLTPVVFRLSRLTWLNFFVKRQHKN